MAHDESASSNSYVTVEIYDQTYHLYGQDAKHIRRLAELVDARMRAVAAHGRTVDSLRVAVLAALNLADELTQAIAAQGAAGQPGHAQLGHPQAGHVRAASLRGLLDEVLEDERKTGS
ncbi:MAG: cell division protein ZapA [Terracidiphilus sp.]|jgi:cell division protein ZapA